MRLLAFLASLSFRFATTKAASLLRGAVDLSYNTRAGEYVSHPSLTQFRHEVLLRGMLHGNYLEVNDFSQGEHVGTHMDAPAHFSKGNWHVDDIPLDKLAGRAVVIDITAKAKYPP